MIRRSAPGNQMNRHSRLGGTYVCFAAGIIDTELLTILDIIASQLEFKTQTAAEVSTQ